MDTLRLIFDLMCLEFFLHPETHFQGGMRLEDRNGMTMTFCFDNVSIVYQIISSSAIKHIQKEPLPILQTKAITADEYLDLRNRMQKLQGFEELFKKTKS